MSLEQQASEQQQTEQVTQEQVAAATQLGSSEEQTTEQKTVTTEETAAAVETEEQKQVTFDDDWRAVLAGDDPDALSELARIKTYQDVAKQLVHQKKELSKRAAGGAFPEDGSDEDKAAWRKANGVPDKGTLKDYGVQTPENYEMTEVESGMLDDFVSTMHGINAPAGQVQQAIDFWFKSNAASKQANNELDDQRHREWAGQVSDELGKDEATMLAAANTYLETRIEDEELRNELLNARLPGGGTVSKHPEFVKMWVDLALQNGYGDRLEADSMESGGKSLAEQHSEIEKLQQTDPQRYNDPKVQARLDKIIGLRLSRGEIDEFGNEKQRR